MLPYLVHNKSWDPDVGAMLMTLVRPGMTFIDVGANVGYFSKLIATKCLPEAIHAFEPNPDLVDVLALNLWGSPSRVRIWPIALGDVNGTVTVQSAENNIGDTRVHSAGTEPSTMVAAVARLDDLIVGAVDVVKIDVQGFEVEVLRGMQRIIRENPFIKLTIEFWPSALRDRGLRPQAVLDQYLSMGFSIQLLRGSAPIAASHDQILDFCESAGPNGQADLLLARE